LALDGAVTVVGIIAITMVVTMMKAEEAMVRDLVIIAAELHELIG